MMQPSSKCLALIRRFEGFRDVAYLCPAGKWTIGYGHTDGVRRGDIINQETADRYLERDVKVAADAVNKMIEVPISQNQFDALVSLVYNIGATKIAASTLVKLINQRYYDKAAEEILKWCHSGGQVLQGLVARRKAEYELFKEA